MGTVANILKSKIAEHRLKSAPSTGADALQPQDAPGDPTHIQPTNDGEAAAADGEIPGLDEISQEAEAGTKARQIAGLNETFFVAPWGSAVRIFHETHDYELDRPTLDMLTPEGFRLLLRNRLVRVTDKQGNTRHVPLADAWMADTARREYPNGIAMLPNTQTPLGVYNLYRGLGVEPVSGDVKPALRHIAQVICDGDNKVAKYIISWCARAVQCPELPAEVALVLKGGRGTGKGTLGRWLLKIFGAHGLQISQSRHLTGNFNGHLRDCLLLFADESFFAGDKAAESVLKALITEDTLAIERKGVDVVAARNRLKVVMASNAEWVAPAGPDERRFCAVKVSDCHKQDHQYFAALNEHMDNGGLAAFLDFLLKVDISGFNIRAVPSTKALEDQKLLSMPPLATWLYSRLHEGRLHADDQGWHPKQARDVVCADFAEFVKSHGLRHVRTDSATVGRQLRELVHPIEEGREASGQRRRLWEFPPLDKAREVFAAHMKLEHVGWPVDDDGGRAE